MQPVKPQFIDRVVRRSLNGGNPRFIFILALGAGRIALQ